MTQSSDTATDFLNVDPRIRRQQFVCVSILTPSDINVRDRMYFETREFIMAHHSKEYATKEQFDTVFSNWCSDRQTELDHDFLRQSKDKPHIPIMKIRGSYKTQLEARERCRYLSKIDTVCDIFIAPVGQWVPADGKHRNDETECNYAEQKMQELMQAKKESQTLATQMFEQRTRASNNSTALNSSTKT